MRGVAADAATRTGKPPPRRHLGAPGEMPPESDYKDSGERCRDKSNPQTDHLGTLRGGHKAGRVVTRVPTRVGYQANGEERAESPDDERHCHRSGPDPVAVHATERSPMGH